MIKTSLIVSVIYNYVIIDDNSSPGFTISVLNFGLSIGSMGLVTIIIAVCLVAITVALIKMRRASVTAAETIEMESDVNEDVRAESQCHHTIKTEYNEAYNYVVKH